MHTSSQTNVQLVPEWGLGIIEKQNLDLWRRDNHGWPHVRCNYYRMNEHMYSRVVYRITHDLTFKLKTNIFTSYHATSRTLAYIPIG